MKCACGKGIVYWSALLDAGFCSDECYWKARNDAGTPEGAPGVSLAWKLLNRRKYNERSNLPSSSVSVRSVGLTTGSALCALLD